MQNANTHRAFYNRTLRIFMNNGMNFCLTTITNKYSVKKSLADGTGGSAKISAFTLLYKHTFYVRFIKFINVYKV